MSDSVESKSTDKEEELPSRSMIDRIELVDEKFNTVKVVYTNENDKKRKLIITSISKDKEDNNDANTAGNKQNDDADDEISSNEEASEKVSEQEEKEEEKQEPLPKKQKMIETKTAGPWKFPPRENLPCIGVRHQTTISPLATSREEEQNQKAKSCWNPNNPLSDKDINKYLEDAALILKIKAEQITSKSLIPVPASPIYYDEDFKPIDNSLHQHKDKPFILRESNIDQIYTTLHNHEYNISKALSYIKSNPAQHITALTHPQQRLFHSAFRRYCGNLRIIHKHLNSPDLECKHVVDYFYRFKIPDQFRKFQARKKEEAQASTHQKKKSVVMDLEQASSLVDKRRLKAKDLLIEIKDFIGDEKYHVFGERLNMYHSMCEEHGNKTFKNAADTLKTSVFPLFNGNMELYTRFVEFLPERFR